MPFEVYENQSRRTFWRLKADNGEIVLESGSCVDSMDASNSILSVVQAVGFENRVQRRKDPSGKDYFNILDSNSLVLATSPSYSSLSGMEWAIKKAKELAGNAPVKYL